MSNETEKGPPEQLEYPNIVERFKEVFQKLGIKKYEAYVDHCAKGDLEDLDDVEKKLYEMGLHPSLRNQVINFWAAEIKVPVPEKLKKALAQERGAKVRVDKDKKLAEGAVWTVEVDDSGMPRIRMIKDETEPGITLTEAQAAAKAIGKEGEAPIVVYNEELGRHMPNFKSAFVKQNLSAAWATARVMDRAAVEGETVDPMDTWIDQQAKLMQLKEVMGVAPESKEKGTVAEIIDGVKSLQEMAKTGEVRGLPDWLSDPAAFIATIRSITGAGTEAGGGPTWLNDPAEFIRTVREIGGEPKTDDTVKTELAELRKTLEDMKEETHRQEIASLQGQIRAQAEAHVKQMEEVMEKVEDLKRPVTGRTELDIIREVATDFTGLLKTELPGLRRDIKEGLSGARLPTLKTAEQKDQRKVRYQKALQQDERIEELTHKLFFTEPGPG